MVSGSSPCFSDDPSREPDQAFPDLEPSYLSHGFLFSDRLQKQIRRFSKLRWFECVKNETDLMGFVKGKRSSGERPRVSDGHSKTRDSEAHFRERCWYIWHPYFRHKTIFSFEIITKIAWISPKNQILSFIRVGRTVLVVVGGEFDSLGGGCLWRNWKNL